MQMNAFPKKDDKGDFEVNWCLLIINIHYWSSFFQAIKKISESIIENLKNDENFPDISDQCNESPGIDGNQLYFLEPYQSELSPMVIFSF
jgi:hypothetical protein